MTVRTREPTGKAGWPNLLIEGMEKRGKTTTALRLSADPRIGASYVIEVGERRADEYAALGMFQIVDHDGTLTDVVAAIRYVMAQPPLDGRPNLLVLDTGTGTWDLVKRRAEGIARSSKEARRILDDDPNAEITVGHQAWNKAKDAGWWSWLNELRAWPGVALILARADEVSKFQDGRPVLGQTDYRVEIESGTRFILDGQVRVLGPTVAPRLITIAKLGYTLADGGIDLPVENPLGHLVFDIFEAGTDVVLDRAGAAKAVVAACVDLGDDDTPTDEDPEAKRTPAKMRAGRVWKSIYPSVSPTAFDAEAIRVLRAAVVADHEAEIAAGASAGATGGEGAADATETAGGDLGGTGDDAGAAAANATTTTTTDGGETPPPDDGARDVDETVLDEAPTEPSTAMDDPEAEAETFAMTYVDAHCTTKTKCVAELALRGIAAEIRGSQLDVLQSRVVDVIRDERLGKRPPPSGLSETGPPTTPVAEQQALT